MSAVITPFKGTELFNTESFNNRISQINTGFSYVSNPNLLDNWYFGNPVNQRGQTEYTGAGYGIDRWKIEHDTVISLSGGELAITGTAKSGIVQNSEALAELLDKRGAFSVLTTSGDLYSTELVIGGVAGGNDAGDFIIYSTSDTLLYIRPKDSSPKSIIAAKLELGPTQTLAHREGDKWVLNEVPDYGEQLRRCLRHDYILGNSSQNCPIGIGTAYSNDGVICDIQLPEYMRTNPAVALSGEVIIRFSATQILAATSVLNYGFSGDKVQLYFPGLSGLTPGQSCDLYTQIGSRLEFNSNL